MTDNGTAVTIYCVRTHIRAVSSKYLTVQFSPLISREKGGERCWQHNLSREAAISLLTAREEEGHLLQWSETRTVDNVHE